MHTWWQFVVDDAPGVAAVKIHFALLMAQYKFVNYFAVQVNDAKESSITFKFYSQKKKKTVTNTDLQAKLALMIFSSASRSHHLFFKLFWRALRGSQHLSCCLVGKTNSSIKQSREINCQPRELIKKQIYLKIFSDHGRIILVPPRFEEEV